MGLHVERSVQRPGLGASQGEAPASRLYEPVFRKYPAVKQLFKRITIKAQKTPPPRPASVYATPIGSPWHDGVDLNLVSLISFNVLENHRVRNQVVHGTALLWAFDG